MEIKQSKKNPFTKEISLTKDVLYNVNQAVNSGFKNKRYNITEEKRVINKLKKIRKDLAEILFI